MPMNRVIHKCFVLMAFVMTSALTQENPHMLITTNLGTIEVALFPDAAPETVANFIGLAEGTKEFVDPVSKEKVQRPYYDGLIFHRVIPGFMIQGGCPKGDGSGGPGYTFADEINAKGLGLHEHTISQASPQFRQTLQGLQRNLILGKMKEKGFDFDMPQDKAMAIQQQVLQELQTKSEEEMKSLLGLNKVNLDQLNEQALLELQGYRYSESLTAKQPLKGALCMANSGPNTNGSQFFINAADTPHLAGRHTVFGQVVAGQDVIDAICAVKRSANDRPEQPVTIVSIRRK
jgi:cyclophilin family peptidyl-prolyl cis-trans isomerase